MTVAGRQAADRDTGALDRVAVGLAATLGSVALVVWLSGEVGGFLTSGSWPPVPFTEAGVILLRLPPVLSDPGQAWPPAVRSQLPSGPLFYALAGLIGVSMGAIVAAGWFSLRRGVAGRLAPPTGSRTRASSPWGLARMSTPGRRAARWATRRDLAPLRV